MDCGTWLEGQNVIVVGNVVECNRRVKGLVVEE